MKGNIKNLLETTNIKLSDIEKEIDIAKSKLEVMEDMQDMLNYSSCQLQIILDDLEKKNA